MSCWPAELTFSVSTSEILAQLFTLNIMTYDYELHYSISRRSGSLIYLAKHFEK